MPKVLSATGSSGCSRASARRIVALAALLLVAQFASPAAAHDVAELTLEELAAEPVFSGSKFPTRTADVPGAVSLITADDIRAHGWRSFDEVLGALRGVTISNDRNTATISARGFGRPGEYNPRFLFLLDGQRLNDGVFDQAPVGRDFPVNVGLIERVEFISGPGSAQYGSGAFIGTVNIITRGAASLPGWRLLAGAGSRGMREGQLSWGGWLDNGADVMLAASSFHSDGANLRFPEYDDAATPGGSASGLDGERARNLRARLHSGATTLALTANDRDKQVPTAVFRTVFGDPGLRSADQRVQLSGETGWDLAPELHLTMLGGWLSTHGEGHYPYPPERLGLARQTIDNDRANIELRAAWTGWSGHRLVGGIELRRDLLRQEELETTARHFTHTDSATSAGIYAEDGWRLDEHWLLNLGARLDQAGSARNLSPRAALIWQPAPVTSIKLVDAYAYRAASEFEQVLMPIFVEQRPPRALATEHIRNTELIGEHYFSNNSRSQISVYRYSAAHLISTSSRTSGGPMVTDNGARTGHGADIETEFAFDDGARLRASAAWQRIEGPATAATGAPVPNTPGRIFGVQASRPIGLGDARLALELRGLSARQSPGGYPVAGHVLVNLNLSALRLAHGVELDAGVFNLFDRQYSDVSSADNVDSRGRRLRAIPQDGRLLRMQVRVAF